jgi:hypothetical protein
MDKITIPHAENVFVDKSKTPYEVLVVATKLPEHPHGTQPEAGAKQEMMKAIASKVAELGLQAYKIHWLGNADASRP